VAHQPATAAALGTELLRHVQALIPMLGHGESTTAHAMWQRQCCQLATAV